MKNSKVIKFVRTTDRILDRAEEKRDADDYVSAVSSLVYEAKRKPTTELYAQIADLYTEMGLFENAIDYWFRYLSIASDEETPEAYNGLGANFYFLGNRKFAGIYFGFQLARGGGEEGFFDDVLEEYMKSENEDRLAAYRVVYPPDPEDVAEENYEKGSEALSGQDYAAAIEAFSAVPDNTSYSLRARTDKAIAEYDLGKKEEAADDLRAIVEEGKADTSVYVTLIRVLRAEGLTEESEKYVGEFLAYSPGDIAELYKKLNFLLEIGRREEAFDVSSLIVSRSPHDVNTNFIRGFLLYEKGMTQEALSAFKSAYLISYNPIALYYMEFVQGVVDGEREAEPLTLSFSLPERERDARVGLIRDLFAKGKFTQDGYTQKQILETAEWGFTENNTSVQIAIGVVFACSGKKVFIDFLKSKLISIGVSDDVKHRLISMLCQNGEKGNCAVVYSDLYCTFAFSHPELDGPGKVLFSKAHAYAFGRLTLFERDRLELLSYGAEVLQRELIANGNIRGVKDVSALGCAIYFYSGLKIFPDKDMAYRVFDAKKEDVVNILYLAKETNEND